MKELQGTESRSEQIVQYTPDCVWTVSPLVFLFGCRHQELAQLRHRTTWQCWNKCLYCWYLFFTHWSTHCYSLCINKGARCLNSSGILNHHCRKTQSSVSKCSKWKQSNNIHRYFSLSVLSCSDVKMSAMNNKTAPSF